MNDPLGVVKIAKGQPMAIGGMWVLSGAETALGLDQKCAAEMMMCQMGGKLLGHPVHFIAEDGACNVEGGQTAATKVAANQDIMFVIRPPCSS